MLKLEQPIVDKLKKDILTVIGKYLNLNDCQVFFFGSRVAGGHHRGSDIDVGIEGPKPIPLTTLSAIKEEIEALPILYTIEVVDFGQVSNDFRQVAKQRVELIK